MGEEKQISKGMKFVIGGLAGMGATCVVQPMDLIKTRMQVSTKYRNAIHCLITVMKEEGILKLYTGLGAGLLRQATYTTARLGIYGYLMDTYKKYDSREPNFGTLLAMATVAGAGGALVGNPAEVALIRMTADGHLPEAERRNYKNVADALIRMVREEGPGSLFRGCNPTVVRAIVVNMTQLTSYTMAKRWLRDKMNVATGFKNHFFASLISGFLTTVASMPVDMAKTRLQNMKSDGGKPQYKGTLDVLIQVAKQNGVLSLWRGFTPYFCRVAPHTVLTFVFLEQFSRLYKKYVLGVEGYSE